MPSPIVPDKAPALVHQGWNQLQLQRPLAAWASWHRALRLKPGDPAARRALATLESAAELPAAARGVPRFQAPSDPARRARWDARFQGRDLGDLVDAAGTLAAPAADDPDDASAWSNYAPCLAWQGCNAEAIARLDRVVRLRACDRFDRAVAARALAEVLRGPPPRGEGEAGSSPPSRGGGLGGGYLPPSTSSSHIVLSSLTASPIP